VRTDVTPKRGRLLWEPTEAALTRSNVARYMRWLDENRGLAFANYEALWAWSVDDAEGFWGSIWDFFEIKHHAPYQSVLENRTIQGANWFAGARLNYAEHALAHPGDHPALIARSETGPPVTMTYEQLADAVAAVAEGLRRMGVKKGDRVAALMPNTPEAVIGFLASAAVGAVWSSCAPEFGVRSVVDRFRQIEPVVLLTVDGYVYRGKRFDLTDTVEALRQSLPGLKATVVVPYLDPKFTATDGLTNWGDLLEKVRAEPAFEPVEFGHPLWVLYSSGTTGLPKAIVQGHGGILIEHLKTASLHLDIGPDDRLFWYTSTGWMMWNFLMSGLLVGGTIVLYDGDPATPDLSALWRLAQETGITYFGTSATFIHACMRAGIAPGHEVDLSRIRGLGSTGSPLSREGFEWVYEAVKSDLLLNSFSGGTDICTGIVGACPLVGVRAGEIACRLLGAPVTAFDPNGREVVGEVGELVLTGPMPSMPLYLWGDTDGSRFRESYLTPYPDAWRHGDFVTISADGACVIHGRSDSTLNRGGVRAGTADFYAVVEDMPEILDSLVVDTGGVDGDGRLVLLVVLDENSPLDEALTHRIRRKIRAELSPRHVPDEVHRIDEVPKTLNGKKMEVPVKRILQGTPPDEALSRDAMANPEALSAIAALASRLAP
jgi:acetoacetyl-CoA synthetase